MRAFLLFLLLGIGVAHAQGAGPNAVGYGPGPCPFGASSCTVTATDGSTISFSSFINLPKDQAAEYATFFGVGAGANSNVASLAKNLSTCFGALTCGGEGAGMTGTQPELVGIGWSALSHITTANNDTAVGVGSMRFETTGGGDVAVGTDAMGQSIGTSNSVAVGSGAVKNGGNTNVVGIGLAALQGQATSTAQNDVAIGVSAMSSTSMTTAQNDVAIGINALKSATTTSFSTAVGANALSAATGNSNTAVGNGAGLAITTGTSNIAIGVGAAQTTLQSGSNNIVIGSNADTPAASTSNYMNLGGAIIENMTAPTISSGFGTTPTVAAGASTAAFQINVGTGGTASSGIVNMGTTMSHGWACSAVDGTNPDTSNTVALPTSTSTITLKNYSRTTGAVTAWTASDVITVACQGF